VPDQSKNVKNVNVAQEAAQLIPTTVTVVDFGRDQEIEYRVLRTGDSLKKIVELEAESELREKAREKNNEGKTAADPEYQAEDPGENIRILYEGLASCLVDKEKAKENPDDSSLWHPDTEFLQKNVDFEVANDLMAKFVPRGNREAGDIPPPEAGEARSQKPVAEPQQPSADSESSEPEQAVVTTATAPTAS
jgi:hypothetical protein